MEVVSLVPRKAPREMVQGGILTWGLWARGRDEPQDKGRSWGRTRPLAGDFGFDASKKAAIKEAGRIKARRAKTRSQKGRMRARKVGKKMVRRCRASADLLASSRQEGSQDAVHGHASQEA